MYRMDRRRNTDSCEKRQVEEQATALGSEPWPC